MMYVRQTPYFMLLTDHWEVKHDTDQLFYDKTLFFMDFNLILAFLQGPWVILILQFPVLGRFLGIFSLCMQYLEVIVNIEVKVLRSYKMRFRISFKF